MKKAEGIGAIVGALLGAAVAGIVNYFVGSPFTAVIGLVGFVLGARIGKAIDNRK